MILREIVKLSIDANMVLFSQQQGTQAKRHDILTTPQLR